MTRIIILYTHSTVQKGSEMNARDKFPSTDAGEGLHPPICDKPDLWLMSHICTLS